MRIDGRDIDFRVSCLPAQPRRERRPAYSRQGKGPYRPREARVRLGRLRASSSASSAARTASSSSPGRRVPARPRRSTRPSTSSTAPTSRSSPPRTPSSTTSPASTSARCTTRSASPSRDPALHPAPGAQYHPRRRNPRPRRRRSRHPGGTYGPPRLLHAPHQRRAQRHHPSYRHGHQALPRRVFRPGHHGPAPRPQDLRRAARSRRCPSRGSSRSWASPRQGPRRRHLLQRQGLPGTATTPATRAARASSSSWR